MHTKTWVVVSVMLLLGILAIFAFWSRSNEVAGEPLVTDVKELDSEVVVGEAPVAGEGAVKEEAEVESPSERRALPVPEESEVVSSQKFEGILEEVNVGCFADGECYVVVDGKHITTLIGWSSATVGSIKGVDGFGDLERFIGEEVSVYAGLKADGTYTLYENAEYYVALKGVEGAYIKLGEEKKLLGLTIIPKKITEDSRCPVGMMCIQAGTVRIETNISDGQDSQKITFELGETKSIFGKKVTFHEVSPLKEDGFVESDYSFNFSVK